MRTPILVAAMIIGASICYAAGRPWPTPLPFPGLVQVAMVVFFAGCALLDIRDSKQ